MNLPGKKSMERSKARTHERRAAHHARRIREHLAAHGGQREEAIAKATGLPLEKVRSALKTMLARNGGVRRMVDANRHVTWERFAPAPKVEVDDFRIAGPVRVGRGSVWGAG